MRLFAFACAVSCFTCLLSPTGFADDDKKPEEKKEPAEVTLTGVFESLQSSELLLGTEELTAFKLKKIVAHGSRVRNGQTLAWFDTEEIDEKIEAAEIALRLAKIDLQDAEFNFEQFRKTQELDKAVAERSRRVAKQSHDNYVRIDRDRSVKTADYNLKSYLASYENAAEELKQLEQMYKEDELTEESEEIVLKRAQQAVDSAKFRLEGGKIQAERTVKESIPQQTAQAEDAFRRAEMAYHKTIQGLNTARQKQDIEIAQKRDKLAKQQADLIAMQAERAHLTIIAPHDGIAYHGELTRGKLGDKPSSLKADSAVTNKQTLLTIVNPAKLQIRTELTETLLDKVTAGMNGTATPNAKTGQKLTVRVKSAAAIPFANNKFDCVVMIRNGKIDGIVPGMTCVVTLPEAKADTK
jgi:HlyD family secretion protein